MTSVPSSGRPNVGDAAAIGVFFRDRAGYQRERNRRQACHPVRCDEETRAVAKGKRTYQPNNRRRAKVHGFRLRMRTRAGRAIVSGRRRKGRRSLTA